MSTPSCSSPFTLRSWLAAGPYTLVVSSSFFGSPYHAGVLAALLEAGFAPSEVAGSSKVLLERVDCNGLTKPAAFAAACFRCPAQAHELCVLYGLVKRDDAPVRV